MLTFLYAVIQTCCLHLGVGDALPVCSLSYMLCGLIRNAACDKLEMIRHFNTCSVVTMTFHQ